MVFQYVLVSDAAQTMSALQGYVLLTFVLSLALISLHVQQMSKLLAENATKFSVILMEIFNAKVVHAQEYLKMQQTG